MIKVGTIVKFEIMPEWVEDLPEESIRVFHSCFGKSFTVSKIDQNGFYVLDVSKLIDPLFGGIQNDIRLEEQYLKKN
jgi:hypothetical protein